VRRVGKSVKAQGQRTICWPFIEGGELKPLAVTWCCSMLN